MTESCFPGEMAVILRVYVINCRRGGLKKPVDAGRKKAAHE